MCWATPGSKRDLARGVQTGNWPWMDAITGLLFGNRAETDGQAVPAVDGNNGQRQVNQFLVGKLLTYCCIRLVWHVVNRNEGYGFRPC